MLCVWGMKPMSGNFEGSGSFATNFKESRSLGRVRRNERIQWVDWQIPAVKISILFQGLKHLVYVFLNSTSIGVNLN